MLESFIPFIPALVPCWFHSSLPTVCRNVPAASTMGERRTCWKAQLSGIPCKLVSENCFPETQRRSVKNLRPQGPQTTQKTRPGCTQKTRALPDTLRLTQPCRTTTGAHEHLQTDFRLCPTNRCTSGVIPEMIKCSFCGSHRVSRYFTRKQGSGPTPGPPIKLRPAIATRSFGWVKIA